MKNLFTLILSLVTVGLFAQTTYYSESFDNGVPETWSVEGDWAFGTASATGSQFFPVPDLGYGVMAIYNDDAAGNGHIGSGTITSSAYDLSAIEGPIVLELYSYFRNADYYQGNERAVISVSSNGETYTELFEFTGNDSYIPETIDISEFAGENLTFQFFYDDGAVWNAGWAFDEVRISDQATLIDPRPTRDYSISAGASTIVNEAQAGIEYIHEGLIVNNGLDPITSYDVTMTDGTETWTNSFTGLDVQFAEAHKYEMEDAIIVEGNQSFTVSISNVNGDMTEDANMADNTSSFTLQAYSALNPDRAILAEEATGTWCQFCPVGTVLMDEMSKRFPENFVGVAVHNNDPMVNNAYDDEVTSFPGFEGFPSIIFDRSTVSTIDVETLTSAALVSMNQAPAAALSVGASVSSTGITTSIKVDFLQDVTEEHNVAIIITEDGVTGSDADGYFQINAWAGGARGPLAGYELLPQSVPASFNVFNHVGRELVGGHDGSAEALDAEAYTAGMTDGWVFDEVSLPAGVNTDKLHIVGVLINRATGRIVNATQASILDAASNGLFDNTSTRDVFDANLAKVYPNPVTDAANIVLNLDNAADVNITVINSLGQVVANGSYGQQSGSVTLQQDMSSFAAGMYMINITAGDRFITKKINKIN